MDYNEAVKKLKTQKVKENYLCIKTDYSTKIILPYKEGLAFMSALENAEQFTEKYQEPHRIVPFNKETLTVTLMSGEEYEQYKIAALLNVDIEDVRRFAEAT